MTTEPHPDYAPITCKTHDKAYCEECMGTSSEASTQIPITQSAYDSIVKVEWNCYTHKESRFTLACIKCVEAQLAAEYERGMKEAPPNWEGKRGSESETIKEIQRLLLQEQEAAYKYWKEKREVEKNYATLNMHHEKALKRIAIAHRIVGAMKLHTPCSPSLQQALKEWDAL